MFGAGGDRDKEQAAAHGRGGRALADLSFLTSDNPRSEDPLAIINEIEKGLVEARPRNTGSSPTGARPSPRPWPRPGRAISSSSPARATSAPRRQGSRRSLSTTARSSRRNPHGHGDAPDMADLPLDELAARMNGRILQGEPARVFGRFGIDSRRRRPATSFLPSGRSATATISSPRPRPRGGRGRHLPRRSRPGRIRADPGGDTVRALQDLARSVARRTTDQSRGHHGQRGQDHDQGIHGLPPGPPVRVLKSEGNFNNNLGLALSVLGSNPAMRSPSWKWDMRVRGDPRPHPRRPAGRRGHHQRQSRPPRVSSRPRGRRPGQEGDPGGRAAGPASPSSTPTTRWVMKIGRDWPGRRLTFGLGRDADVRAASVRALGLDGMAFELSLPGRKGRSPRGVHL